MPKVYVIRVNMSDGTIAGKHVVFDPGKLAIGDNEEAIIYETREEFIEALNSYYNEEDVAIITGDGHTDPQVGAPDA